MTQKVDEAVFLATRTTRIRGAAHSMGVEAGKEYKLKAHFFHSAVHEADMVPQEQLEVPDKAATPEGDTRTFDDKYVELVTACEAIIADGSAKNFTQLLKPKIAVVRGMVDFDFNKQTMLRAYDEAIFRTEQNDSISK
jgi:hypothetical protein